MVSPGEERPVGGALANTAVVTAVGSDQENADPDGGSLRKLWQQGTEGIATHRTDNLFQSLEERTLTEEEQRIIEQRVALQRRMFEEYERRELRRKVAELQEVCPDLSTEEVEKALELCDGREDDAAAQLVSDASFKRQVKAECGLVHAPAPAAAPAPRKEPSSGRQSSRHAKPAGPRPKLIDPATLAGNVFMGAFRGKGFKPPPKSRAQARRPAAATKESTTREEQQQQQEEEEAVHQGQDEEETDTEEETEEEHEEEQSGEEEEQQQQQSKTSQQSGDQHQEQLIGDNEQQQEVPGSLKAEIQGQQVQQAQQPRVLLWPAKPQRGEAVEAEQSQRYVLVQADTLQAPSNSLLRAARRQLGEPSDSKAPPGSTADAEGPTPASVARSRPLHTVAEEPAETLLDAEVAAGDSVGAQVEEGANGMPSAAMLAALTKQLAKLDDGKAKALLQQMPSDAVRAAVLERLASTDAARATSCCALLAAAEPAHAAVAGDAVGEQAEQQAQAAEQQATVMPESQQRGSGSRRACAGTRQAAKRATPAVPSEDDEETESEGQAEATSEEDVAGTDSDEDFAAPSTRRTRRAPARQVQPRVARPSRAAKQAAAAAFVAYGEDSEDEGSDAEMAEAAEASSDEDMQPAQRRQQRRSTAKARGGSSNSKPASPPTSVGAKAADEPGTGSKKQAPARKRQRVEGSAAAAPPPIAEAAAEPPGLHADGSGASSNTALQQQDEQQAPAGDLQAAEASDSGDAEQAAAAALALPRVRAISSTGHTCRGRVKQKSHKSADLVEAGSLRPEKGWFNAGYIFPEGFQSRTLFRSSVSIDQLCVHECHIIGKGGQYWPQPTFKVVALDRPDEPLIAKSCTGCWTGILKRINAEIEARRRAGENLPPPPKTAIAGPEYFGLNQPNIQEAVEALDPDQLCTEYWAGKQERMRAAAGLPASTAASVRASRAPRPPSNGGSKRSGGGGGGSSRARARRRGGSDSDSDEAGEGEEDETQLMTNKWSAVSRSDRYRKRLQENGDDTSVLDKDNPLPHFIDPITMSAVVRPAISPYGYVAGLATWKVVLAEKQQCPFTNQPLQFEQLKVLTKTNIHLHRHKIVNGNVDGSSGAINRA